MKFHPRATTLVLILVFSSIWPRLSLAQQEESYDYFRFDRQMIQNGVQAILMCNGLFTSNRTPEQVFDQELAYLRAERWGGPVGTAEGGDYEVDRERKSVAIGCCGRHTDHAGRVP